MHEPLLGTATYSASSTSACSSAPAAMQPPRVMAAWWSASVRLPGRAASRLAITVSTDPDGAARVAVLATPGSAWRSHPGLAVACTSARPMAGTLGCGAGATLRGEGDESPQGRATHTHGGSPHHQRHLFSTGGACASSTMTPRWVSRSTISRRRAAPALARSGNPAATERCCAGSHGTAHDRQIASEAADYINESVNLPTRPVLGIQVDVLLQAAPRPLRMAARR